MKIPALAFFYFVVFAFFCLFPSSIWAATLTLTPTSDTCIGSAADKKDSNFGHYDANTIGIAGTGNFYSLYKFDISTIPAGATINSAMLKLYQSSHGYTASGQVMLVQRVLADWAENAVTWNTMPAALSTIHTLNATDTNGEYKNWVITDLAKGWISGQYPNFGLMIGPQNDSAWYGIFNSRENANNKPQLLIDYTPKIIIPPFQISPPPIVIRDIFPPKISNIKVLTGFTTATVSWTTDEKSSSFVEYLTGNNASKTAGQDEAVTNHTVSLSGLKALTTYKYVVMSQDPSGNRANSAVGSFFTIAPIGGRGTPTPVPVASTPALPADNSPEPIIPGDTGSNGQEVIPEQQPVSTVEEASPMIMTETNTNLADSATISGLTSKTKPSFFEWFVSEIGLSSLLSGQSLIILLGLTLIGFLLIIIFFLLFLILARKTQNQTADIKKPATVKVAAAHKNLPHKKLIVNLSIILLLILALFILYLKSQFKATLSLPGF